MLTGEVRVNNQTVVKWYARNVGPAVTKGYNLYAVETKGVRASPNLGFTGNPFNLKFQVPHDPNNGIFILTSTIMVEIASLLT